MALIVYKNRLGIGMLLIVIIVSLLASLFAVSATVLNMDMAQFGMRFAKGHETIVSADGCVEEAIMRLHINPSYAGDVFTIDNIVCSATITRLGQNITVKIKATNSDDYVRELEVIVAIDTSYHIVSWKEL